MIADLVTALALYLFAAVGYYLGYWADITSFIHTRYPARLDRYMRCAACSGAAYSAIASWLAGALYGVRLFGIPCNSYRIFLPVGILGIYLIPFLTQVHLYVLANHYAARTPTGGDGSSFVPPAAPGPYSE